MERKYAILLVRVSGDTQFYEAQILDLTKFAKDKGFTDFKEFSTKETGFADFEKKIGTNEMFQFIKANPSYNYIFVTEISRLGRRASVLHAVKDYLVSNKIQLFIKDTQYTLLDESKNLSSEGSMMFSMYTMFAEAEMKQKFERFQRKKKELLEGGHSAGGKVLFGYDRVPIGNTKKNTYVINESQAEIIRTIYNWYLHGIDKTTKNPSLVRITTECIKRGFHAYTKSKRNVNKLLKEEGYTGKKITKNKWKNPKFGINSTEDNKQYLTSNNIITYHQIIDSETYNAVQIKMHNSRVNVDKETLHTTILSKLIICPSCGRFLGANYRIKEGKSVNSYRCGSRNYAIPCDNKSSSISMNVIDSAVWSLIKTDLPTLSKKISEINPNHELAEIEFQLSNIKASQVSIQDEINFCYLKIKGIKSKDLNANELLNSQQNQIEIQERKLNQLEKEKVKLETRKTLVDEKQLDIEMIIKTNLDTIENSKELVKKYINSFVSCINIIEHKVAYTILEIILIDYSVPHMIYKTDELNRTNAESMINYLIIDKRITRNMKLLCVRTPDIFIKKDGLKSQREYIYDAVLKPILDEIKIKNYKTTHSIEYTKLNIETEQKKEDS